MWNGKERKVSHWVCLMCLLRSPTCVLSPAEADEREKVKALLVAVEPKSQLSVFMIDSEFTVKISNH